MHIDKSSGINKNHDNIELQQQISQNQQASVFGDGFPDKNNNGIVDEKDFKDASVIELLRNNKLLNCFWGDVYKKVNDLISFTDNINVKTNTLYKINRKDGYDLKIVTVNNSEPVLQIQSPNKSLINIPISVINEYSNENVNNEEKIKRISEFAKTLSELTTNVLSDFTNEINKVKLIDKKADLLSEHIMAEYEDNTIIICNDQFNLKNEYKMSNYISHEIGHAIDDMNSLMASDKKQYSETFKEFKSIVIPLLKQYLTSEEIEDTYMLANWWENFACIYADIEGNDKQRTQTIEKLMDRIKFFKNSNEKRCYELYQKLKDLVKETVNERRQLPREQRCDDSIKNKIETLCNDESFRKDIEYLIEKVPQLDYLDNIDNYKNLLLQMTDENFNDEIKNIENFSNDPLLDNKANENLKIISNRIIAKLMELRNDEQIQNIRQKYLK